MKIMKKVSLYVPVYVISLYFFPDKEANACESDNIIPWKIIAWNFALYIENEKVKS